MSPDPNPRNRTRRISGCHRHPSHPVTGFCPLCLHERLATLSPSPAPDLRRSKSVSASNPEPSSSFPVPRRNSCDVKPRNNNTLSTLFTNDDETKPNVQSKNLEQIRVLNLNIDDDDIDEGEVKTMKEHIDLELNRPKEKGLWAAASVLSKKLLKWRQKKVKNQTDLVTMRVDKRIEKHLGRSEVRDYGLGRRSCDTEPRFSIDGGRMSLDEPRASWDGYLIARTIPRLTPMLAGVNHSIVEDETTNSDSSSSKRGSSFDRSSSVQSSNRKTAGSEVDEVKSKLVITERELKDWHLGNGVKDDCLESSPNQLKKSSTWRKVCNILGPNPKINLSCENERGDSPGGLTRSSSCVSSNNAMMVIGSYKSRGSVKKIKEDIVVERNRSNGYSPGIVDTGLLRFHLTPFRSHKNKSGKGLQQSHSKARNSLS